MKSYAKFKHFHSMKCVWKCRLWNGGNFVSASMSQCVKHNDLNFYFSTSLFAAYGIHPKHRHPHHRHCTLPGYHGGIISHTYSGLSSTRPAEDKPRDSEIWALKICQPIQRRNFQAGKLSRIVVHLNDVMTWRHLTYYWSYVRRIHHWLVDSPHI